MKKDIIFPVVSGVSVAIVRTKTEQNIEQWNVYCMNENSFAIGNLIISARGYGSIANEYRETSTLRYSFGDVGANSFVLVEPIDPSVFPLNNEYWVSYYIGDIIYDKRFIFVPDSIVENNLIPIKILNMEGVLHE